MKKMNTKMIANVFETVTKVVFPYLVVTASIMERFSWLSWVMIVTFLKQIGKLINWKPTDVDKHIHVYAQAKINLSGFISGISLSTDVLHMLMFSANIANCKREIATVLMRIYFRKATVFGVFVSIELLVLGVMVALRNE